MVTHLMDAPEYPAHTRTKLVPAKPFEGTVYLHLYHGRCDADEDMDEWGFDGPFIPVQAFGFTYETLWIIRNGDREELKLVEGCVEWDGKFYGDFEVIASAIIPA